ncbi:TPA: hypothetical protein P2I01_004571 [Aeromonas salmonicida]|uniref:hypothetical protein n=1 Tax=Aeromonas salmonicida TaxID=645 RepID=UPI00330DDCC5|nr:hypothetical protein [Aeromonas salmonicida]
MVEKSVHAMLDSSGLKTFPFQAPDNIDEFITYMRNGNRTTTKYYSMDKQIDESLFICSISTNDFDRLVEIWGALNKSILKYQDQFVLGVTIRSFDDFKANQGQFVREFQIGVTHITELT